MEDKDIKIKLSHIKNIETKLDLKNNESDDHIILALFLYKAVKKWGFHFLPLRMLHELDISLIEHYEKLKNEVLNENN